MDERIKRLVTERQHPGQTDLATRFSSLLQEIIDVEKRETPVNVVRHDVDVLFTDRRDGRGYYLEVKYNDDHDTFHRC